MKRTAFAVGLGSILLLFWACGTDVGRTTTDNSNGQASTVTEKVKALRFSQSSGYYTSSILVAVSTDTPGVSIFCTQDGQEPTKSSTAYTQSILIKQSTILLCRGFKDGFTSSDIGERLYVIEGSSPPVGKFASVKIDISLGVDGEDQLRIQDGVMNLIHVSGDRPENPVVKITRPDGTVDTTNPWNLDLFHAETGISCNWSSGACVSAPLDLKLTDFASGGFGYIPPSSLDRIVWRDSVSVNDQNRVVIHDGPSSWSGYWFTFEYWYTTSK